MSRRIKSGIKGIYRRILSVKAVCLFRARGLDRTEDPLMAFDTHCFHREGELSMKGPFKSRMSLAPLSIFSKMLGCFPCPDRPIQPVIYRELLSRYNNLKKEFVLDFEVKRITAKPASPNLRERVELLHKPGLERPRGKLNLARDALEALPSF